MMRLPKLLYNTCIISRSGMKDGMTLLDLGCGWGSVALYFAEKFKKSRSPFVIKDITFVVSLLLRFCFFVSVYTFYFISTFTLALNILQT